MLEMKITNDLLTYRTSKRLSSARSNLLRHMNSWSHFARETDLDLNYLTIQCVPFDHSEPEQTTSHSRAWVTHYGNYIRWRDDCPLLYPWGCTIHNTI